MRNGNEAEVGERLHRHGWRKAFTVAEMVGKWDRLVGEVERGYDASIYEYTHDLYCRNWLHEAWLPLDDRTVLFWTPRIKGLDERFRAAMVHDDGLALGRFHRVPHADLRWWRRCPRVLVGELGEALRSAGAADA